MVTISVPVDERAESTERRWPRFRPHPRLAAIPGWACLAAACAVLALVGLGPWLLGYRTETVLSGSMRPTFAAGDVLLLSPEPARDVRVGQIISYHIPIGDHHVEAHRIVRIVSWGAHPTVITRGDANPTADPWQARLDGSQVWVVRGVIPELGSAIRFLRTPIAHLLTVVVTPLLLVGLLLWRIWRRESEPRAPA